MLSQLIWWSGIALEIALLVRGLRGQLVRRLPIFYAYLTCVALQNVPFLFRWNKPAYAAIYWVTEFLGLAMGSLVIFEIYKVSLQAYPGAARMARNALAFVFVTAVAKGLATVWASSEGWGLQTTAFEIERALRTVQAAAILALVALFLVYSIPFGRNLRGILLGYGLFIGERVICLTFMPPQGHHFWFYAYSAGYLVTLIVWLAHLWSYEPSPVTNNDVPRDWEYHNIAAATQRRLRAMRASVRKAVRS